MDRAEMVGALEELGLELEKQGISARLYIVGGAVMVLDFASREMTDDVDGGVYPAENVLEVAAVVGRRRGLNSQWLNDSTLRGRGPLRSGEAQTGGDSRKLTCGAPLPLMLEQCWR